MRIGYLVSGGIWLLFGLLVRHSMDGVDGAARRRILEEAKPHTMMELIEANMRTGWRKCCGCCLMPARLSRCRCEGCAFGCHDC